MRKLVTDDLAKDVSLLSGRNDYAGFHPWTEDELAHFETQRPLGTRQCLAWDLLLYTSLRHGDAVRLGRPRVRDGEFTMRTEKTGMVAIAPMLPTSILAMPTGELTFVATERSTVTRRS